MNTPNPSDVLAAWPTQAQRHKDEAHCPTCGYTCEVECSQIPSTAALREALRDLVKAAEWHIASNADAVVGKDGRQLQTLNMIKADHAIVDSLERARTLLAGEGNE